MPFLAFAKRSAERSGVATEGRSEAEKKRVRLCRGIFFFSIAKKEYPRIENISQYYPIYYNITCRLRENLWVYGRQRGRAGRLGIYPLFGWVSLRVTPVGNVARHPSIATQRPIPHRFG